MPTRRPVPRSSAPLGRSRWTARARAIGSLLAIAIAIAAPGARADDDPCAPAAEQAEELLGRGELAEARRRLVACARPSCPREVVDACERLASRVEDASASIVLAPVDEAGADVPSVEVEVDGSPVPYEPGRAIELDPGDHALRVKAPRLAPIETTITVREGEKRRIVTVRLRRLLPAPARPTARPEPPRSGPPLASMLLFGGAATTLGTSALLGIYAQVEYDALEERCATPTPACTRDDTAKGRTHAITSTVTLGASLALAAAGLLVWWLDGRASGGRTAALAGPLRF